MLSIGKLGGKGPSAEYYLGVVADGAEEYYLGRGEAPGRWIGDTAARLGLSAQVVGEVLLAVLNGLDPSTGRSLLPALNRRTNRIPGFDLTFSAPKGVSLLYGLGDLEVSRRVQAAHHAAVGEALGYLERHATFGRRGANGTQRVPAQGLVTARFDHRTSRAGDVHLHSHVLVPNLVRAPDGRWSALDARALYAHAKTAGTLYQASLRYHLRDLGLEWELRDSGLGEVAGFTREQLRQFSRRREEIEAALTERGDQGAKAAQVATLATRKTKTHHVDPDSLRGQWAARAGEVGLTRDYLQRRVLGVRRTRQLDEPTLAAAATQTVGPEGLTKRHSTFTHRDVLRDIARRLPDGGRVTDLERVTEEALGLAHVVPLTRSEVPVTRDQLSLRSIDGVLRHYPALVDETRYSTAELMQVERDLVDNALRRQANAGSPPVAALAPATVQRALDERPTLSDEQAAMVRTITTAGDGVAVVVGAAGSGKTYALEAARAAWEAAGYQVAGVALSAQAAGELAAGSGIESITVARLLLDLREAEAHGQRAFAQAGDRVGPRGQRMVRGTVLVVDEAAMVGTRALAKILEQAERDNAKVVLVGDHKQLPEIDAGGAFRGLLRRLPAVELLENRRQQADHERQAVALLRAGEPERAIEIYDQRGQITAVATAEATRTRLVAEWYAAWAVDQPLNDADRVPEARSSGAKTALMLAQRRADVDELNDRAREVLRAGGHLGEDLVTVVGENGERSFAAGDAIVVRRNSRRLGLRNGDRGVVLGSDDDHLCLRFDRPGTGDRLLPLSQLQTIVLTHGYATTVHVAQGATTSRAFVLGSETIYAELGYTAATRNTHRLDFYVVCGKDSELRRSRGRTASLRELSAALGRSTSEQLSLDAPITS